MGNLLNGKKILLFSQYFFGYEKKIKTKMEELGAYVDLYDEMSIKNMYERAVLKVLPAIFKNKTEKYYGKILEDVKNIEYDYVLFIDCEMPTENVLRNYREEFSNSIFCLHLWDSVGNLKGVEKKFKYFDYITTFDRDDAQKYELMFRPLFYCDEYKAKSEIQTYCYDISFIGTIHSDRYRILKRIFEQAKRENRSFYFYPYLQSKFIYYIYRVIKKEFKGTSIGDFKFAKLDSKEISKIIDESRIVIDIQHPKQTGLTMRTLEMLGMKKKLVTTNADIMNYDFYCSNNISIIDRNNPIINSDLYCSGYQDVDEKVYEFYSINQWCIDVLGVGKY